MRHLAWTALAWLTCAAAGQTAPADAPVPPQLTADQGAGLVRLARMAMRRYLTHRMPADEMPVVRELEALTRRSNVAAVTLRSRGAVKAFQVGEGQDLCTNVIAAALRAMRSSELPDRVDRKVLDALTVEVEVLSAVQPVGRADLARSIVPGRTGLVYSRAAGKAWILPSRAYVLGLDADGMRRRAMEGLPLRGETASRRGELGLFLTRHYVGFPGGRTLELFRGKDLARRRKIDQKALRAAAEQVGQYLLRRQDADGRYVPHASRASLRDHLYAAWAMAQLARRVPRGPFGRSAAAAAAYAARQVDRAGGAARVPAGTQRDTIAATALLALALGEGRGDEKDRKLREDLVAGLAAELEKIDFAKLPGRPKAASAALYLAFLALVAGEQPAAARAEKIAKLRKGILLFTPGGAPERLWAYRAGLTDALPLAGSDQLLDPSALRQLAGEGLPDEKGGFAPAGGQAGTVLTGLTAVCISQALRRPGKPPAEQARRLQQQRDEARAFCFRMMYQPGEAYFAEKPDDWVGAVRVAPADAAVTLPACAAAIEAFLAD